jgi:UbiD family decarboxylase
MARIRDLRDYLDVLESLGDVERIDRPVSAMLEAAAITRRSTEQGRPAPLFDNVEGAKDSACLALRARCPVIHAILWRALRFRWVFHMT